MNVKDMNKEDLKKDMLVILKKYGIIKQSGSTEITIKTNGVGILGVRVIDINNY